MTDTTDTDQLRAAAAKLRSIAGNATEGAWAIWRDLDHQGYITVGDAAGVITPPALESTGACNPVAHVYVEEDAEHIALMHPGVGLALAVLLDAEALRYDRAASVGEFDASHERPLAVARQVLGTTTGQPATAPTADLGPADGQQKTRLLAKLHDSLTPIPGQPETEAAADRAAVLASTLREVLDTFGPMTEVYGGPVAYYDGSADITPKQYEGWRAVLDDEAQQPTPDVAQEAAQACACNCQFIDEPWIKMHHAADCPAATPAPAEETR